MLKLAPAVLIVALLAGCGSSSSPGLNDPDVAIQIASGFPALRAGVDVPMTFNVYVLNRSSEPITVEQMRIESTGMVSFSVRSRTEYFQETIAPGQAAKLTIMALARAVSTRAAANEPLMVRITANFGSELGRFQRIYIRDAGGSMEGPR
jgi:hypothetical protein